MFDSFDKEKLEELKNENELFYNKAVQILSGKNSAITPFSVKEIMVELKILCENDDIKEIIESEDAGRKAYIMLQTGDVTTDDLSRLIELGLLDVDSLKKPNVGETKHYTKVSSLDLKAPVLSIKDKDFEEKLSLLIKDGIYSREEVQKMINNGLVDKEKLDDYLRLHGIKRESRKRLSSAFEPVMSFDGVRLSNDIVIGGTSDGPKKADEMANKQIYIF